MSSPLAAVRLSIASDGSNSRRPFRRHEEPVAAALALDRVRVGLVAEIASDGQALTSNRRRAVELELQQA